VRVTKALQIVASLLAVCAASAQTRPKHCIEYEPIVVHLVGRIERQTFPGPPNCTSTTDGDQPDVQWVLHLSNPVCVNGMRDNELNSDAESGVSEIQLVIANQSDWTRCAHLIGKNVSVTGTLFHSHTAHHRTQVLLTVRLIEAQTARPRN